MTSLHPFYKVGDQISEAILRHRDVSKKEAVRPGGRHAPQGEHPHAEGAREAVPARVLRRDAAAGDDRDVARAEPRPADRRRAHDGARRDGPGADPGADRPAEAGVQRRRDDHHPRPRRRGRVLRRHPGDVRRQGRRVRQHRRHLLHAEPPLHVGSAAVDPHADRASDDRLNPITGRPPSLIHVPPGCSFHPRCPYAFEPCDKERAARSCRSTATTPRRATSAWPRRSASAARRCSPARERRGPRAAAAAAHPGAPAAGEGRGPRASTSRSRRAS